MTKDQLWKIYTDKNPSFLDPEAMITMPAKSLKKFFDQTWDQSEKNTKRVNNVMDNIFKAYRK